MDTPQDAPELHFGMKKLSTANWLEPDIAGQGFVRWKPGENEVLPINGEEWLQLILHRQLDNSVPESVQALFEVARGAMVYGNLFYPLYTLGAEQLFRVADAATVRKCQEVGCPYSEKTFERRVYYLVEQGWLPGDDLDDWESFRALRNMASHPDFQTIIMPFEALHVIEMVALCVNALFA